MGVGSVLIGLQASLSEFSHVDVAADAGAQIEAFFARVTEALGTVADFLNKREPSITSAMRAWGLSLRLFIEVRMNQDQLDIEFPPALLAACGRHNLSLYLITNDIPASEVHSS